MRKLLCLVLILLLPLCALAEGDLPAWDYPVAPEILQDPNDYIRLANRENLLDGSYVPSDLVRVTAKHVSGTFQLRKTVNDALLTMFARRQSGRLHAVCKKRLSQLSDPAHHVL